MSEIRIKERGAFPPPLLHKMCLLQYLSSKVVVLTIAVLIAPNVAQVGCDCNTPNNIALLRDFFNVTEGPTKWKVPWNFTSQSVCQFVGIACTGADITSLYSWDNGIGGSIPASVGGLTMLRTLVFSNYAVLNIRGTLPSSLGNLTNLEVMTIQYSGVQGQLPSSLVNLRNLQTLCLLGNSITGTFPSFLLQMPWLSTLQLGQNKFSGTIPEGISKLYALQVLDLGSNYFQAPLPTGLSNLTSLYSFAVGGNMNIDNSTVPQTFSRLQLRTLSLANALFSFGTFPQVLCSQVLLKTLDVSNSQLSGAMPECWTTFTGLVALNLVGNKGLVMNNDTVPMSFNKLQQLRTLAIAYINFTAGTFPQALCELVNITSLDATGTQLSGSIPQCFASFVNFAYLKLSGNTFPSTLPRFIFDLSMLTAFICSSCLIAGPLNLTDFSRMPNLQVLDLGNNSFGGTLGSEVGLLRPLTTLSLCLCGLSGALPTEIGNLTSLAFLSLYGNNLNGTVPSVIGSLVNLKSLYLYNNFFAGTVPQALSSLSKLVNAQLQGNQFVGSIPQFLFGMVSLVNINLGNNRLVGPLPRRIASKVLQGVAFNDNSLTGGIPQLWYRSQLVYVGLQNNVNLAGILPPIWGLKNDWQQILVSHDGLTGILPSSWGGMRSLNRASLQGNYFGGSLPSQWGNGMKSMQYMYVAGNSQLCGGVPSSWTNRTNPMPSDSGSISNAACNAIRFITTPPPSLRRRVTLQYCSGACRRNAGFCPATPQTDEELADMTAVATNASHVARYLLLGGGMISSDPTTLRWLSGALGDTDDGEGTIFYVEDATLPSGQCAMPCGFNVSNRVNIIAGLSLVVDTANASWTLLNISTVPGHVGCMCQTCRDHNYLSVSASSVSASSALSSSQSDSSSGSRTLTHLTESRNFRHSHSSSISNFTFGVTRTFSLSLGLGSRTIMMSPSSVMSLSLVTTLSKSMVISTVTATTTASQLLLSFSVGQSCASKSPEISHSLTSSITSSPIALIPPVELGRASATATVATMIITSAIGDGGGAVGFAMMQTISQSTAFTARCSDGDDSGGSSQPLMSDVVDNMLHIELASLGGELGFVGGSILSNAVIAFIVLVCRWASLLWRKSVAPTSLTNAVECVRHVVRSIPGTTFRPLAAVIQPLVAASIVLLAKLPMGGDKGMLLGCITLAFLVVHVGWLVRRVALNDALPVVCVTALARPKNPTQEMSLGDLARIWTTKIGEWRIAKSTSEENASEYLERYGDVVAPYRGGRHWFFAIELMTSWFVATVSGVSMALPHTAACGNGMPTLLTSLQLVGSVALGVLCLVLKPFDVPLEGFVFLLQTLWTSLILIILLAGGNNSVADGMMLAQSIVVLVMTVPQLVSSACRRGWYQLQGTSRDGGSTPNLALLMANTEFDDALDAVVTMACAAARERRQQVVV